MLKTRNKKGFTLIELLIVITLIGILSAIFVTISNVNLKRARDSRRQSDLELIRSGIETFRADCNSYPTTSSMVWGGALVGDPALSPNCLATNTYISKLPQDPSFKSGTGPQYVYSTANGGITYQICAALEAPPSGTTPVTCNGSTSCGTGTCNYQAINP